MRVGICLSIGFLLVACEAMPESDDANRTEPEPAYFETPREAVPAIARMLRDGNWAQLASYYDLSGSEIFYETLTSGDYFIAVQSEGRELPPLERELSRYRHPFHPSFEFLRKRVGEHRNEVIVEVVLEIDQGAGQPPQRVMDEFGMVLHSGGWQILPDE